MDEPKDKDSNLEVDVALSDKGLSLKAKGAGTMVLLAISIGGIIFVAYLMAKYDNYILIVPLMFLLFITYHLINILLVLFKTGYIIDIGG